MGKIKLLVVGLIGFLLGALALYFFLKSRVELEITPPQSSNFNHGVMPDADPFAAMEQMREEMEKGMGQEENTNIISKEDDQFVWFEINGTDSTKLNTSVENGYLQISGETHVEKQGMQMTSSFHRMFPVPPNVDAKSMETVVEGEKVVLRFKKRK